MEDFGNAPCVQQCFWINTRKSIWLHFIQRYIEQHKCFQFGSLTSTEPTLRVSFKSFLGSQSPPCQGISAKEAVPQRKRRCGWKNSLGIPNGDTCTSIIPFRQMKDSSPVGKRQSQPFRALCTKKIASFLWSLWQVNYCRKSHRWEHNDKNAETWSFKAVIRPHMQPTSKEPQNLTPTSMERAAPLLIYPKHIS